MSTAGAKPDLTMKLSQLQNLCKRDPDGYKSDYLVQLHRFKSEIEILKLSPSSTPPARFVELLQFIVAVVSSSYRSDSEALVGILVSMMNQHGNVLTQEVRRSIVSGLILMRNKGVIEPLKLMELFFKLMTVQDKVLRQTVYTHIITDLKNMNKNGKNEKVNRKMQSFMHKIVTASNANNSNGKGSDSAPTSSDIAARRCVDVACELYRRKIWTDERCVAILASATQSPLSNISVRAIKFFLGIEDIMDTDKKSEEEDIWAGVQVIESHQHSRKTKAREKHVMKQVKNRKKAQQKRELADDLDDGTTPLYPAIEILNDPQGLAEGIFKRLRGASSNYKFETKLVMINFVTRLIGCHERYLGGHQKDVTMLLAYTVQATHQYVPPDDLKGILKTIAHNFITERCSEEQMAVGINAARAICTRVPSLLGDDDGDGASGMDMEAFARDIAGFSRHRDKSVQVASKAWLNFVRETHPALLQAKDRGLLGAGMLKNGEKPVKYGETKAAVGVEGAELLLAYEENKKRKREEREQAKLEKKHEKEKRRKKRKREAEEGGDNDNDDDDDEEDDDSNNSESEEEMEMDSDDDSGGWNDVSDDDDDDNGSDSNKDDDEELNWDELETDSDTDSNSDDNSDSDSDSWIDVSDDEQKEGGKKVVLSKEEKEKMRAEASSTRIFSAKDFARMKKLAARENAEKRDPRAMAKRRKLVKEGKAFDDMSEDEGFESEDEGIVRIKGMVQPENIMAEAVKRKNNRMDRLQSIMEGRSKFEQKKREGGSTNTEKLRKKTFAMVKNSQKNRAKGRDDKQTKKNGAGRRAKVQMGKKAGKHNQTKRRRR